MIKNERKNKHMTLEDRIEIQECLTHGMAFKAIAQRIGKSQTTVSREVKLHLEPYINGYVKADAVCPKLLKAPFVCNGCDKKSKSCCQYKRLLYRAKNAQAAYEELLVEARTGIPLNKASFYETERIISNALQNGQHVYHAIKANNLPISTATVYRHINKRYYSVDRFVLPRAVKFKPRKSSPKELIPLSAKKGRLYEDYLEFVSENPDIPIVELDTVIGRIGGKAIMTLHFVSCDFMVGILLNNKTAAEVGNKIRSLKQAMNDAGFVFGDVFPVLLTDNGGEFSNINSFEYTLEGDKELNLFFCKPSSPQNKPHIEKNHTLFRDIVPGGTSFDDFTQDTVNLIFSHMNAVKRKQFNGKSAYDLFTFSYSNALADVLGISFIPADTVCQTPKLLKKFFS